MDPSCDKYSAILRRLEPTQPQSEETETIVEDIGHEATKTDKIETSQKDVVDALHEWTIQGGRLWSPSSSSESEMGEDLEATTHRKDETHRKEEDSDELPPVDEDVPLEEMEKQYWRYNAETGHWKPKDDDTATTTTNAGDNGMQDNKPMDGSFEVQDVETLTPQRSLASDIPDVVKSCEPHESVTRPPVKPVRRVGGARVRSRKRSSNSLGDAKPRKPSSSERPTSHENDETKSSQNASENSEELTTGTDLKDSLLSRGWVCNELVNLLSTL